MEPLDSAWDGKGILKVGDTANLLLGDFDGDRPFDRGDANWEEILNALGDAEAKICVSDEGPVVESGGRSARGTFG
jgi:hypothetical protein